MALSRVQSAVLAALRASAIRDKFYWTGGTLLAERYLHHRDSFDIDLFSDEPVRYEAILPVAHAVKEKTRLPHLEERRVFDRWEFFLKNHREIRFEFVHYAFPALHKRTRWRGILVDSLEDIAANKVMALLDRREPKDAVDLYYLMTKKYFTVEALIRLAQKKFEVAVDASDFWGRLLWGSKQLGEIRTILHGNPRTQARTVKKIQDYVSKQSAAALRREF